MNDKSTMNKIMEYMALAKPIVQFELTEGRFSAREASLYARPNDAADFAAKIVTLLDDPQRRRRMGAARARSAWSVSSRGSTRRRSCSPPTRRSFPSRDQRPPTGGRQITRAPAGYSRGYGPRRPP